MCSKFKNYFHDQMEANLQRLNPLYISIQDGCMLGRKREFSGKGGGIEIQFTTL